MPVKQSKNHNMLEKALRILEYIANQREGVNQTEVAKNFGIPKSSAHSLVNTLYNLHYLEKKEPNRFCIGVKAFEVGSKFIENNDTYTHSQLILRELVAAVDETAHLAFLDGAYVVYISKCECSHTIRMVSSIGKRIYAYGTALGKALLSGKTEEEIRSLYADGLQQITAHTITDIDTLLAQLAEIRSNGFAGEKEESTLGVCCIAVPITDKTGRIVMGMSISIPLLRFDKSFEKYKEPLLNAKKRIEMIL
jgi:DNA-binding IclR family transcriptional regulator